MILELYDYLTGKVEAEKVSEIGISCKNHMMVFAAEKSRREDVVVDVKKYTQEMMK